MGRWTFSEVASLGAPSAYSLILLFTKGSKKSCHKGAITLKYTDLQSYDLVFSSFRISEYGINEVACSENFNKYLFSCSLLLKGVFLVDVDEYVFTAVVLHEALN